MAGDTAYHMPTMHPYMLNGQNESEVICITIEV